MGKKLPVTEHIFKLDEPIKVASKGDEILVYEIKLKAPCGKHRNHLIRLKQGFFKAAMEANKSRPEAEIDAVVADETETSIEETAKTIMALFYMSNVDLVALEDEFKTLLVNDIGEVSDGIRLNAHMIDQMSLSDFERLMSEYLAVFILSSST